MNKPFTNWQVQFFETLKKNYEKGNSPLSYFELVLFSIENRRDELYSMYISSFKSAVKRHQRAIGRDFLWECEWGYEPDKNDLKEDETDVNHDELCAPNCPLGSEFSIESGGLRWCKYFYLSLNIKEENETKIP
jgi:hypothetical protein